VRDAQVHARLQIPITPFHIHQPLAQVYGEWVSRYSSFTWIVEFNDFFASNCSLGRDDDVSTMKEMVGCHERWNRFFNKKTKHGF
jgi:hypothetical protein